MNLLKLIHIGMVSGFAILAISPSAHCEDWEIFVTRADNWDVKSYQVLSERPSSLPQVTASRTGNERVFEIRSESDALTPSGLGSPILSWIVPEDGDWKIEVEAENLGTDVKGGDGGSLRISVLAEGQAVDTAEVADLTISPSSAGSSPSVSHSDILALEKNDRVNLRLSTNVDGFGDRFLIRWRSHKAGQTGRRLANHGYEAFLANPPPAKLREGAKWRPGLFVLGADGGWANSEYAEESVELIRKFVPDLAVVMVAHQPEKFRQPGFYKAEKIPTIIQSWGGGYEPFLKSVGAFEIDWEGRDLSDPRIGPLAGSSHAASLPHPETRRAFSRLIQSSLRSGYSGYGFCDMVWNWGAGRGATGYNPKTVRAFQTSLTGEDEGFETEFPGGGKQKFHFDDYARYYIGGMPTPAELGIDNWNDYQPLTRVQHLEKPEESFRANLLFDLLCHYEWLKMADKLGRESQSEGGFFQAMPNPEDVANGADFLFLSALPSVKLVTEQFFGDLVFFDAAYRRFPYISGPVSEPREAGVVVEAGAGGNDWPYYAPELAYVVAYDVSLAASASHLEADFWPSARQNLDEAVKTPGLVPRYQSLLAYGLGFRDAWNDRAERLKPDFLSVSSRSIFRPWGEDYLPWSIRMNNPFSPDLALARANFAFQSIGEEALQSLESPGRVILYSPSTATEAGWKNLTNLLSAAKDSKAVVPVHGIQTVVTKDFQSSKFSTVFPGLDFAKVAVTPVSGSISDGSGKPIDSTQHQVFGDVYGVGDMDVVVYSVGNIPVVVRRQNTVGNILFVLFDPSRPDNQGVAQAIYSEILKGVGISPRWGASKEFTMRVYKKDDLHIACIHRLDPKVWNDLQGKPLSERHLPYDSESNVNATLHLEPSREYVWAALPSGVTARSKTDASGNLRLTAPGVTSQVFMALPDNQANRERINLLSKRSEDLAAALTLGGRVPARASLPQPSPTP